jgi:membrane protein
MVAEVRQTLLSAAGPAVLSYLISVVGFFLLYFVLPNTSVQVRSALWGAAVAALVWSVAKWGFGVYVTEFIPYQEVYGVLGLIPLGIFWIFVSWLIVLFGLQLAFTTQHLQSLDRAQIEAAKKHGEQFIADDMTVIGIMQEIAGGFEAGRAPVSLEAICSKFSMPADFCEKILNCLLKADLVARADEPRDGFVPGRDPEDIKLSQIHDVVLKAGFGHFAVERKPALEKVNRAEQHTLADYNLKEVLEKDMTAGEQNGDTLTGERDEGVEEEFDTEDK